jgi:hypothetical protein
MRDFTQSPVKVLFGRQQKARPAGISRQVVASKVFSQMSIDYTTMLLGLKRTIASFRPDRARRSRRRIFPFSYGATDGEVSRQIAATWRASLSHR